MQGKKQTQPGTTPPWGVQGGKSKGLRIEEGENRTERFILLPLEDNGKSVWGKRGEPCRIERARRERGTGGRAMTGVGGDCVSLG